MTDTGATSIVICGALGRMGGTVARLAAESGRFTIAGGVDIRPGEVAGAAVVESARMADLLSRTHPDVVIDFTMPEACVSNVKNAAAAGAAVVVGTTGLTDVHMAEIRSAVKGHVPAVISSNYSIGMNIFWQLVRTAAPLLSSYDIEVTEAHHRYKKDAPSGTAKTILQVLNETVGPREVIYGRSGMTERKDEIGVHVIRGGDIVGDHSVMFSGNFETITLSHRAYDRSVFAKGALLATSWVKGKSPGIYQMADVLGLDA